MNCNQVLQLHAHYLLISKYRLCVPQTLLIVSRPTLYERAHGETHLVDCQDGEDGDDEEHVHFVSLGVTKREIQMQQSASCDTLTLDIQEEELFDCALNNGYNLIYLVCTYYFNAQ